MRFHFAAIPVHGGAQSVLPICVSYIDATSPAPNGPGASRGVPGRKERIDHRETLDDAASARFAAIAFGGSGWGVARSLGFASPDPG